MKKFKLKKKVKNVIIVLSFALITITSYIVFSIKTKPVLKQDDNAYTYVNDYIFDNYYPVVKEDETIGMPYTDSNVKIHKSFYEKEGTKEEQEQAIIYHEGTYMQNSGVSFTSESTFDVTSILSGTVTDVTDDPLLGKSIEIRSSTEIITMSQSLSDVLVKKGDLIEKGQVIGKSGTCKLYEDINNVLHVEVYKNGAIINPTKYFNKELKTLISE